MGPRPSEMRKVQLKTRSFVAVGLFIFGFTAFSFWGLSSQNNDFLVKIEQLEDTLKISHQRQKDLEEKLELMMSKASDTQKTMNRYQEDIKQKGNVIIAQANEASLWRDKVRTAEFEIDKLKTSLAEKEKVVEGLQKQVQANNELKDKKMKEAEETIAQLRSQLEARAVQNAQPVSPVEPVKPAEASIAQPPQVIQPANQPVGPAPSVGEVAPSSSSSSARPAESNQVLAKPGQEPAEEEQANNVPNRYEEVNNEPVGPKPEGRKPDVVEVEPADADVNVIDSPAKGEKVNNEEEEEELGNDLNINEPNLINSQGDHVDEPSLADPDAIRNGGDIGLAGHPANDDEDNENLPDQENDEDRDLN